MAFPLDWFNFIPETWVSSLSISQDYMTQFQLNCIHIRFPDDMTSCRIEYRCLVCAKILHKGSKFDYGKTSDLISVKKSIMSCSIHL